MKQIFMASALVLALASCKKDKTDRLPLAPVQMSYIDLGDTTVKFNRSAFFDLDSNGQKDIYFTTMHVGDPQQGQDKKQWLVMSSFYCNLPVNAGEQIPMMTEGTVIPVKNFQGYKWYNASSILLAQKLISDGLPAFWEGQWKDAVHQFIPFQVVKNHGFYNGWVEVSFDSHAELIVLHRAALSREPNREIETGN